MHRANSSIASSHQMIILFGLSVLSLSVSSLQKEEGRRKREREIKIFLRYFEQMRRMLRVWRGENCNFIDLTAAPPRLLNLYCTGVGLTLSTPPLTVRFNWGDFISFMKKKKHYLCCWRCLPSGCQWDVEHDHVSRIGGIWEP